MATRCLFESSISSFISKDTQSIFGILCEKYHGNELTTTRDAWLGEIEILKEVLTPWNNSDSHIVFEYDIPRLGKRIDVVLLLKGIIVKRNYFYSRVQSKSNISFRK